jgi:hypothetical protein
LASGIPDRRSLIQIRARPCSRCGEHDALARGVLDQLRVGQRRGGEGRLGGDETDDLLRAAPDTLGVALGRQLLDRLAQAAGMGHEQPLAGLRVVGLERVEVLELAPTRLAYSARGRSVEPLPPYDLRHAFASLQVHAGMSIPELAEQMGHSLQQAVSTYAT